MIKCFLKQFLIFRGNHFKWLACLASPRQGRRTPRSPTRWKLAGVGSWAIGSWRCRQPAVQSYMQLVIMSENWYVMVNKIWLKLEWSEENGVPAWRVLSRDLWTLTYSSSRSIPYTYMCLIEVHVCLESDFPRKSSMDCVAGRGRL